MPNDSLKTLYTRSRDAQTGFDTMVSKAEPEFRPIAQKFHDLHADHCRRLIPLLSKHGVEVDRDGSVMGAVNTAVVTARSWVDDIDGDTLDNIRNGEQHVLDAFDDAIDNANTQSLQVDLGLMKTELTDLLSQTSRST